MDALGSSVNHTQTNKNVTTVLSYYQIVLPYPLSKRFQLPPLLRFFDQKTNMSTLSGFRQDRWADTTLPLMLKALSDAELVACMHRYF